MFERRKEYLIDVEGLLAWEWLELQGSLVLLVEKTLDLGILLWRAEENWREIEMKERKEERKESEMREER